MNESLRDLRALRGGVHAPGFALIELLVVIAITGGYWSAAGIVIGR
jgi:prepilin-type N-terminal cleavage/methylation domain-containing protein